MIALPERLTIANCDEVRQSILSAASAAPAIALDATHTTSVDLAGVQIIVASALSARATGRAFELRAPEDGAVTRALRDGGFDIALSKISSLQPQT